MGNWRDYQESMEQAPEETGESQGMAQRVEQEYQQVNENHEVLSDVEKRLHKANLYRLILENPLIESNGDSLAQEVEAEIREYVIGMLQSLMGIGSYVPGKNLTSVAQFSEDEVKALRLWAGKLLNKPSVMKIEPKAPTKPEQKPTLKPVVAPSTRGRGRPPGTGKHQIAARAANAPKPQNQVPQGKKILEVMVQTPDGPKPVQVDATPTAKPLHATPKPMPSPEEALAFEMARSNIQTGSLEGNQNSMVGMAINHFTKE